jgi:predicted phage terminase large subunit-like protein
VGAEPNLQPLTESITSEERDLLVEQLVAEIAEEKLENTRQNLDEVRVRCRTFEGFVKEAWPILEPTTPLRWSWHLTAMCQHLEAISRGTMTPWLIINVPPGSSKSTLVSVLWQAWEWGPFGKPSMRYVSTSFELDNVKRDTRKTRDLVFSDWYQMLWPDVVKKRAGELSFANTATGSREGVAFKSVTGKRGDRVVIDDPHSLEGAESELQRNNTVRLFLEGGLNRSNDALTSAMVVVMQRLHEDDLTGALLARDLGFVHLCIPMEFEPARRCQTPIGWQDPRTYDGELMDPVRFPKAAVERQQKAGEYSWAGQYQQRPAPREGGMFKVEHLLENKVKAAPGGGKVVSGWDFAASKRKTSPYTVRGRMRRVGGDFYIEHIARRRTNPTELSSMVGEVVADDGYSVLHSLPQDPGQAGKVQKFAFAEQLAGYNFKITPETGDKVTRAEPFAAMVGAGRVWLVDGPWVGELVEELRNFPSGSYKDQVDALSRAFGELVGLGGMEDDELPGPELVEEESGDSGPSVPENDDPWGLDDGLD